VQGWWHLWRLHPRISLWQLRPWQSLQRSPCARVIAVAAAQSSLWHSTQVEAYKGFEDWGVKDKDSKAPPKKAPLKASKTKVLNINRIGSIIKEMKVGCAQPHSYWFRKCVCVFLLFTEVQCVWGQYAMHNLGANSARPPVDKFTNFMVGRNPLVIERLLPHSKFQVASSQGASFFSPKILLSFVLDFTSFCVTRAISNSYLILMKIIGPLQLASSISFILYF
jgi:hypothetical protein